MLASVLWWVNIVKTSKAFKGYARSCSIEVIESKDHQSITLTVSRLSIKDLFKDLSSEIKGFKYQIILKVLFSKYTEKEFPPVYFNSTTKTVNGSEDGLDRSFQDVFKLIDNCISEWSGWMIESIEGEYFNVSIYSPLTKNSYIELPNKLRNSKKGLISIKIDDNNCFCWCHIWLNQLMANMPMFLFTVHCQEVPILNYLIN